jgi:hypothetical protein
MQDFEKGLRPKHELPPDRQHEPSDKPSRYTPSNEPSRYYAGSMRNAESGENTNPAISDEEVERTIKQWCENDGDPSDTNPLRFDEVVQRLSENAALREEVRAYMTTGYGAVADREAARDLLQELAWAIIQNVTMG